MSWLFAVCVSIAFADATSAGQEVCAVPAEAERATTVATLNTVASTFLISSILSDCGFELRFPAAITFCPSSPGPLGPQPVPLGCRLGAMGSDDRRSLSFRLVAPWSLCDEPGGLGRSARHLGGGLSDNLSPVQVLLRALGCSGTV